MKIESFKARMQKQHQEREQHRAKLEIEHGLTSHPKADQLYSIAWSLGHSSGFSEVELYYSEIAELLKP